MIIFRYFTREILSTVVAVTGLLLLIFVSNQFIRYLAAAAAGEMSLEFVLRLMMLEIPNMLGLLLPLATFLAIILTFGRMYAENEMTIFAASGFSRQRLIFYVLSITGCVAFLVALLSLEIGPYISADRIRLLSMGSSVSVMDTIVPGRFQTFDHGKQVIYVGDVTRDRNKVKQIFNAELTPETNPQRNGGEWVITTAKQGHVMTQAEFPGRYFVAQLGQRYQGVAGQKDFQISQFEEYGVKIPSPSIEENNSDIRGIETSKLWPINNKNPAYAAELQWRISIPLCTMILAFIAVPLSQVRPRQGKYAKVFPAVLILVTYSNMMFVIRNWLSNGVITPALGFWWLHAFFIGLGLLLIYLPQIRQFFKRYTLKTHEIT